MVVLGVEGWLGRVLYNDVQNVDVMNTSAFYLEKFLNVCSKLYMLYVLSNVGITLQRRGMIVTDYLSICLFICFCHSVMMVMSKIITLQFITVPSLQFVQKNVPLLLVK